jgi:ketosteroid isomerase-like protein
MTESNLKVAARLFEAIENKNPDGVAAVYHDDVAVWHNFSNATQDKATNLQVLTGLCESLAEIHYDVVERLQLADGRVLQRHVLRGISNSGEETLIPACMLLHIRDGKIARIEEYLDTGQANRLRASSGRPPLAD